VVGIAMPWDSPTGIRDMTGAYTEVFRRGAFARTIAERGPGKVKFLAQHNHQALPLGRAQVLREDPVGLYVELRASKTAQADEVLELVRDGALDALSIGFRPDQDRWNRARTLVERLSVRLAEVSAVTVGAYDGAVISGVRSVVPYDPEIDRERAEWRLKFL
jgi:HK97 family phage prohead protease